MKAALSGLRSIVEGLEADIKRVDDAIRALGGKSDDVAVAALLKERKMYQLGLDILLRAKQELTQINSGAPLPETNDHEGHEQVIPGQYMGCPRLSVAVQAYLIERGRGPIPLATVVADLIVGGFKIDRRKSKFHRGELRDPDTRDLRLLANNNRKRFQYDSSTDSIAMRPAQGNDTSCDGGHSTKERPLTRVAS